MTLIANALGTPPADMIKHIHDEGPQGRGAVRIAVAGPQARRRRRRHHHRPGRRGRRALRRGRLDRAVAAGRQGGRAGPVLAAGGIGSGQQIAAALALGAQGAWTGSQWLMVEESENTADPARRLRQGHQPRHRPQPVVHRQAGPDAAQRLDRGVGEPGQPEAARHAAAVHGVRHGRRRHPQVPQRDASTSRSTRSARSSVSSPRSRRPRR